MTVASYCQLVKYLIDLAHTDQGGGATNCCVMRSRGHILNL
jgi:hypothetical protein